MHQNISLPSGETNHSLIFVLADLFFFMVSLDDFPTLNEVLEKNQKTRDRSPIIKFLEKFSRIINTNSTKRDFQIEEFYL